VTEPAGMSPTDRRRYCPDCGGEIRPGARFCVGCGCATGSARQVPVSSVSATGQEVASTTQPRPVRSRRQDRTGRRRHAGPLAIGTGVLIGAALAAGVIEMTHAFGHAKLAATSSVTTPRHSTASRSPASPSVPPSPSLGPSPVKASSSAPPSAEQQAAVTLAELLAQSESDRQAVNAAYNDVGQCGPYLTQDVQTFQTAATSHDQLLNELAGTPGLSALPQAMVQDLSSAWKASAAADRDFSKWAQDQAANGCSLDNQSDPNFAAANGPDLQATRSKTAFIQLWNPLAQSYGLPTYSQSNL
jgi:hypothetical protein